MCEFDFVLSDQVRQVASCVFIQKCWRQWAGRRRFKQALAGSMGVHIKVHRGANAFKRIQQEGRTSFYQAKSGGVDAHAHAVEEDIKRGAHERATRREEENCDDPDAATAPAG